MIHHYYQGLKHYLNAVPADVDYDFGQLRQNGEDTINRLPLILIKFNPIVWSALPQLIQEADIAIDVSIVTSDRYGDDRSIDNSITDHQPLCDAVFQALQGKVIRLSDYIDNLPTNQDQIILNTMDRVNSTHPVLINNLLVTTYRFEGHGIDCTAAIARIEADFDIVIEYKLGNTPIADNTVLQLRHLAFVMSNDNNSNVVNFDPANPLINVVFPQNVPNGYAVRTKYLNGYGNFTLINGQWSLNWFEPLSDLNVYLHEVVNGNFTNTYVPEYAGNVGMNLRIRFNDGYGVYTKTSQGWALNWFEAKSVDGRFLFVVSELKFTSNTAVATQGIVGSVGMSLRIKFQNGYANYSYTTSWQLKWFEATQNDTRHLYVETPIPFDQNWDTSEITGNEGASMRVKFPEGYAVYMYSLEWNLQWFEPFTSIYWLYEDLYWIPEMIDSEEFENFNPESDQLQVAIVDIIDCVIFYKKDFVANAWSYMFKIAKQPIVKTFICNLSQENIGDAVSMTIVRNDFEAVNFIVSQNDVGDFTIIPDQGVFTFGRTRVSASNSPDRFVFPVYYQSDEVKFYVKDNGFKPIDLFYNVMLTIEVL